VVTSDARTQAVEAGSTHHSNGTHYHVRAGDVIAMPASHAAWLLGHPVYRHLFVKTDEEPRRAVDAQDVSIS
jgi:hypothetical protein